MVGEYLFKNLLPTTVLQIQVTNTTYFPKLDRQHSLASRRFVLNNIAQYL